MIRHVNRLGLVSAFFGLLAFLHAPAWAQATKPLYPEAKPGDVVEEIGGYKVRDPYRWMETAGAADKWVDAENAATERHLAKLSYPGLEARITEVFGIGFVNSPQLAGKRLFYQKREAKMEQPALYVSEDGKERKLVDPGELDKTGKTTLDWVYPSPDGRFVAYGLSSNGDENSTLHVYDVEKNKTLAEAIAETRACSLSWLPEGRGFFYTRYPQGDRYNRKVYLHVLGAESAQDSLIFGEKRDKSDWTSVRLSDDAGTLLILENHGYDSADLYAYTVATQKTVPLFKDLKASVLGLAMKKGRVLMATSYKAPKGRVLSFAPEVPAIEQWKELVPEGAWPLEGFEAVGERLVLRRLENVSSHLYLHDLTGAPTGEIALPTLGSVEMGEGEANGPGLAFSFTSFFYPPTAFVVADLTAAKPVATRAVAVAAPVVPEDYEITQTSYPSYDGTKVNLFIVKRKDLPKGPHPTLLYCYGGFQVNMTPYFSRRAMFWLDRGGIYAVPNLRGGSEFGEDWHLAGTREKKHQVFRDFEYAMRYLIGEGYTTPQKLAIEGGSNGGLLMGAMMTQAPELFAVALSSVGLYDMIRYHLWPPAELWVSEYGSAAAPKDVGFLLGYSPYHQLVPGLAYPAFFGDTAESDTRVNWLHTAKFVAALQAASSGKTPILFKLERKAGHGQGKAKSDVTREYVDKMKFIFSIIGDPALDAKAKAPAAKAPGAKAPAPKVAPPKAPAAKPASPVPN